MGPGNTAPKSCEEWGADYAGQPLSGPQPMVGWEGVFKMPARGKEDFSFPPSSYLYFRKSHCRVGGG